MDLNRLYTHFFIIVFVSLAKNIHSLDSKFKSCAPRNCGYGPNISYPFYIIPDQESYCGFPGFQINCTNKHPILALSGVDYLIKDIFYQNHSIRVLSAAVYENLSCPVPIHNISLDRTPFSFSPGHADFFFLFNCTKTPTEYFTYPLSCASNSTYYSFAGFHEQALELESSNFSVKSCQSVVNVPVDVSSDEMEKLFGMSYTDVLEIGFLLNWTAQNCSSCEESGGRCGFENKEFVCFCRDRPYSKTCPGSGMSTKEKLAIGVGVGAGICCMLFTFLGFCFYQRRKNKTKTRSLLLSRNITSEPSSKIDREKGDVSFGFGVQVFTYEELQEATNNFASDGELGDGGFGTVYYGNLQDGRSVAVKRLYENNYKRVEQFMNEVKLLARLRHRNLVQLYGCTSRHSRELLLVYEYISNGTLADHLHGEYAKARALPWNIRLNTAIETASALTYLHNTDIIHRDVKTNNILLDKNFTVKVADFGLSRLFPINATHVSTAPQGTPGYVDPEYHQCYQLTDKSDVFSFGVVLIELISSMTAVDITRHRHEINLSTMAINKIQNQALHELVDVSLGFDSDCEIRRMITDVAECAFQCLQHEKDMRPSMEEVFEALQRIKNPDYSKSRSRDLDFPGKDDAALLKKVPLSPVSVTDKWGSTSSRNTTPNTSS